MLFREILSDIYLYLNEFFTFLSINSDLLLKAEKYLMNTTALFQKVHQFS